MAAVGVLSRSPAPALARSDDPPPAQTQADRQKADEERQARQKKETEDILKRLAEEAAKSGASFAPPVAPAPAAPPAQPVAQPAATSAQDPTPAPAPAAAPAAPATHQPAAFEVDADRVRFDFSEPTEVQLIIKFVQEQMGMQVIATDGGLAGQKVYFGDPITIDRKHLMRFLVNLLEQKEYTITRDMTGVYIISPRNAIPPGFGEMAPTQIIQVPGIKPSSLQGAIQNVLTTGRAGAVGAQPVFLDDMGLILLTDTPRNAALVQELIERLVAERRAIKIQRFDLRNISASSARDRVLELVGSAAQRGPSGVPAVPGQAAQNPAAQAAFALGGTSVNLGEHLTVDASSNALFFRGRLDEGEYLRGLLELVDVPNSMVSRWYPVGLTTSEAVSSAGRREQLGEVTSFESSAARAGGSGQSRIGQPNVPTGIAPGAGFGAQQSDFTGSGFILYPDAGGFIYRGTEEQHARVQTLVVTLKDLSERDRVVYEFYKLKHGKAADVAEVIQNLLSNSTGSGNRGGGLVGRGLGGSSSQPRATATDRNTRNPRAAAAETRAGQVGAALGTGTEAGVGALEGDDIFVTADEPNNQIVVKAPAKLQPQFRSLISKIDLHRPQVYIDAKIVAVTSGDDFRLAVEAQQIIGQFAYNVNFGLGSLTTSTGGTPPTTSGGITSPKNVATNLMGLTAALIKSKYVPLVITALAHNTDSRIIASPQLLVDDNEQAEVSSLDQQATTTTTQTTGNPAQTSFGGYESAGPKLTVKPQISEGGYMRLEYEIELSSFTGSSAGGVPPPKQENKIRADSVTVPSDTTIVVGGLTFDTRGKTIVKVPLLGDIPIAGTLFRDYSESSRRVTLFVFITPRIMRDPTFADLRLLTRAPLIESGLPDELPPPIPERIDIVDTARADTRESEKAMMIENRRRLGRDPKRKEKDKNPYPD